MMTQKRKLSILSAYPLTERVSFSNKALNHTYGSQRPILNFEVGQFDDLLLV